jgi:hypothetical protein
MLDEIMKAVENLRIKVYAGQNNEETEKELYDIEQLILNKQDEVNKTCNKPAVSVVLEPIELGSGCPHFQECFNIDKNQHCDFKTLTEIDCFVWQTER